MKTTVLFVFLLCGSYLSAGVIHTAQISVYCEVFDDNWNISSFSEEISQQHVGSAMASASGALDGLCGTHPDAWVQGLNFDVYGGGSAGYSWGYAHIHGGAWFAISGGVGTGLAYFNYQVGVLVPENEAWAHTNAGPLV